MPLKFRRAFFYFYAGLFVILAPLLVLYTAGYRFNIHTFRLAQVGALSVVSVPKGATLTLDGEEMPSKTPTLAKRTLPGTYTLTISKDGYTSWQRQIEIKSRETTIIDAAVLFAQNTPTRIQSLDPVVSAATHDGSRFAYVVKGDPWLELWVYELSSQRLTLLDRLSAKTFVQPQLRFSHDDYLLILEDLSTSGDDRRYYTQSGATGEPPAWFAAYTFTEENGATVLNKTSTNGSIKHVARFVEGEYELYDVFNNILLISNRNRGQLLILDDTTVGPPILFSTSANWANIDGRHVFLSDGVELHRFDLSTNTDTLITRSSAGVNSVVTYPVGETLFLVNNKGVTAMDVSDPSKPVNTVLLSAEAVQTFWIDHRARIAYAVATINGERGLFQWSIVQ